MEFKVNTETRTLTLFSKITFSELSDIIDRYLNGDKDYCIITEDATKPGIDLTPFPGQFPDTDIFPPPGNPFNDPNNITNPRPRPWEVYYTSSKHDTDGQLNS